MVLLGYLVFCLFVALVLGLLGWSISRFVRAKAQERRKGWIGLALLGGVLVAGWPLVKIIVLLVQFWLQ